MEVGTLGRAVGIVQTVADHLDEFFEIERLQNRVANRVGGDFVDAALPGRGEYDDVGAAIPKILSDFVDELVPVDPGHHQVEKHEIELAVLSQLFEPDGSVLGQLDVESDPSEDSFQKDANCHVVVDDENFSPFSLNPSDHSWSRPSLLRNAYRADAYFFLRLFQ